MKTRTTHPRLSLVAIAIMLAVALACLLNNRALTVNVSAAPTSGTLTVTNTNDSGSGSLRQAILDAAPADTIDFNLSGCPCTITLTSGELVIDKDLTISGPAASLLTISGNNASRVFFINPGAPGATTGPPAANPTVSITNLTIANGKAQGGKGGDFGALGGSLLTSGGGGGGGAGLGGALFCNRGNVTIDHVSFSSNQAIGGNGGSFTYDISSTGGAGGGGIGGDGGNATGGMGSSGRGGNGGPGAGLGGNSGVGGSCFNCSGAAGGEGAGGGGGASGGGGPNGSSRPGEAGGFGGGGGGGGSFTNGGAGGPGGFGGGSGGSGGAGLGGTSQAPNPAGLFGGTGGGPTCCQLNGSGGGGGGGLGGAIFVRAGSLNLSNSTFNNNSAQRGNGGKGPDAGSNGGNGQGKGGAIFINAGAVGTSNSTTFGGNTATDIGCGATDNSDVYGILSGFSFSSAATQVVFDQQLTNTEVGGNITPAVTARVVDQCGNLYPGYTVTLALGANPSGATLSGTTSVAALNGIATFNGLSIDRPGRYTLTASSGGLTGSTSNLFVVYEESCVSGLRGWWKGENNGDDAGPFVNNGTLSNVGFAPGRVGQAFDFNGNGFVQVDNPFDLAPGNAVTFEAWVNPRSAACNTILSRGNGTDANTDYMFNVGFNGSTCGTEMKVALFAAGAWDISNSAVPLNAWSHVAVSYDGFETRFYINGNLDRVVPHPGTIQHSTTPFYLGRQGTACNCNYFNGLIDEPSVYNRALSASEVLAIFAVGSLGKCPANLPPVARAKDVTVSADGNCSAMITSAQVDDGSSDPDSGDTITMSLDNTGPFTLGAHQVTLTATDNHGARSSATANVTVVDNTPPVLTLIGDNPMTLEMCAAFTDPGAIVQDACDPNAHLSEQRSPATFSAPGIYTITYNAIDASGNHTSVDRTINVVDTTPPAITLNGGATMSIESCSTFVDPGASAKDVTCNKQKGDLSSAIVVTGHVDTSTPGTYLLRYNVSDPSGNPAPEVRRTVNVVDMTAPTLTLNGLATMTVEACAVFNDPGAHATDCSGDLTSSIAVLGSVNTSVPGTYTLRYTVSDQSHNTSNVTRTVTVVDTTRPIINLNGPNPMTVELGSAFSDPGAAGNDGCRGSVAVTASGSVNPNLIGTYTLTYNAKDASNNAATPVTRTVKVVDRTGPKVIAPPASSAYSDINCQAAIPNLLPQVVASDLGGPVTLSQSPLPGTLVPVGQLTIAITGKDPSGNMTTASTTFTVIAGPSFTVSVSPSTVKRGGSVTLNTAFNNCATTNQALTLHVSLTNPSSKTLVVSLPFTMKAGQKGSLSIPVPISKSTPTGVYSLTLDVYVGGIKIGTSTAQLTVTQ